jgi:glycosyltransferase involved in cell wall biosynthesis
MINVLMRTSDRPELFWRALSSVRNQSYQDVNIIVAYDNDKALRYIPDSITRLKVTPTQGQSFFWNLYCNDLKNEVSEGWFFYLDDDDYLTDDNSLFSISSHLVNPERGVICQFIRNGHAKPSNEEIEQRQIGRGRIGGSCIFLHHSKKGLADWDGKKGADFRWISELASRIEFDFIPKVVVTAGNNGLKGRL